MTGGTTSGPVDHCSELAALLPEHELGGLLGNGGFGHVVAAFHRGLDRPDAVKQLAPHWAADRATRDRFVAEGRLLAKLNHPHIVRIFHAVYVDPVYALVMERLEGGTLTRRCVTGVTQQQSCAVALAVLSALHEAHRNRVLHRDVKPANILFTAAGTPKVVDFGIAEILGGLDTLSTPDGRTLCGTPAYMAPEQAIGDRMGPRTDVYSAGVVLYEMLTGTSPHETDGDLRDLLERRAHEPPRPVGGQVPPGVAVAVMRALERDPRRRYASAEAFAVTLATEATRAFGSAWLDDSGIKVELSRAVGQTVTEVGRTLGATVAFPPAALVRTPPPAAGGVAAASGAGRRGAVAGQDVAGVELVPVRDVVAARRPSVGRPALAAAVLGSALAGLAFLGPAGAPADSVADPHDLRVAGVAASGTAELDLARPVLLSGLGTDDGNYEALLTLSAAGVELGRATSGPVATAAGQPWETAVRLESWTRWVAGGQVRARVDLVAVDDLADSTSSGPGPGTVVDNVDQDVDQDVDQNVDPVTSAEFEVRPVQAPYTSVMGSGALLLALFAAAYAEALVVTAWRRRRLTPSSAVVVFAAGGLLGAATAAAAAAFTRHEPAAVTVVGCALAGAAACTSLALTAVAGARRPVRRRLPRPRPEPST